MPYESMQQLKAQCMKCTYCPLCETRHNVVFGVGPEDAEIMFIGEGPGEQEDLKGEPFVGPAGQLLDEMLSIIGLSRRNCYIGNIVKCRPPKNRDPLNSEQENCRPYLDAQIQFIQPKLIVCLGRISAMQYIRPDFRITREHGQWFDIDGTKRMAMYHPSALLRDLSKRPETFRDLKSLQAMAKEHCTHLVFED
ncbi:MAG: uracil-DNA glycosylase [Oscillospiraceae bacterium]|nr:uracil-DNA glycosylase [Oscillospiraceae bacterium]